MERYFIDKKVYDNLSSKEKEKLYDYYNKVIIIKKIL